MSLFNFIKGSALFAASDAPFVASIVASKAALTSLFLTTFSS